MILANTALIILLVSSQTRGGCSDLLRRKKISDQFPLYAAHGSHSLTLNDIQAFFKPKANENNGIKIVNFNLTNGDILLPNAPLIILDNKYI